jgi:predicted membrane metal-binding protein
MAQILGVNRFPWRIFWACMVLGIVAALVPRWLIPPVVVTGAFLVAAFAVRDEVRRLQMPRSWDR